VVVGMLDMEVNIITDILCADVLEAAYLVDVIKVRRSGHGASSLL
jgi:hypothetical protein